MTESDQAVRSIYDDVQTYNASIGGRLGHAQLGFEVLYGPPISHPPIFFVGYQPGGGKTACNGHDKRSLRDPPWPPKTEYGIQPPLYRLAERLQVAFRPLFLSGCTGLNAIFWRSPRESVFRGSVDKELRTEIESFSMRCVWKIIRIINPQMIVVLGNRAGEVFRRNSDHVETVIAERPVSWSAKADGFCVHGMPHPSASLTNNRLQEIGQYLLAELEES